MLDEIRSEDEISLGLSQHISEQGSIKSSEQLPENQSGNCMISIKNQFKYTPSPKNLWKHYEEVEVICDERLSPAKIVKVARLSDK